MKLLAILLVLTFSISSFASVQHSCDVQKIKQAYKQELEDDGYEYEGFYEEAMSITEFGEIWEQFEYFGEYGDEEALMIFEGSSNYYGGYGVEAIIVDKATCQIVDKVQVYCE